MYSKVNQFIYRIYNYIYIYSYNQNIYIYPLFFRFFFHRGHYRVVSRVPCATYFLYIDMYVHACSIASFMSDSLWPCGPQGQAPPSRGFSRQEYQSGLPCPSPGNLPNSGIETMSLTCLALAGGFFTTKSPYIVYVTILYTVVCMS